MCGTAVWKNSLTGDAAALVGGQAGGLEVQQVGVGAAADGVEERVAVDLLAALELRDDAVLLVVSDLEDLLAEAERGAALAHEEDERLDHLAVDEVEDRRPRLDDRDLDVQRRDHRRVLEADDAGAHDDQVARAAFRPSGAGRSR